MSRHPIQIAPSRAPRRAGYTLVELLLALSLLAVIGVVVSSVLFSFCRGTENRQDLRRRNLSAEVACGRIDTAVRGCGMLLACGEEFLVLWAGDSRANRLPNLSELRRIEWDQPSGEIRSYAAVGLADADDLAYELTADFAAITASMTGSPSFPFQPLAAGVRGWEVALPPEPQSARLVGYRLTLGVDAGIYTVRSSSALRGQASAGQ